MNNDEQQIRELIQAWADATLNADLPRLLELMAEDVVFLVSGQAPMRKHDFVTAFQSAIGRYRIESSSYIQEIMIGGELACCWNHLTVTMTVLATGQALRRNGPTLSVFRKTNSGTWVLARDANLLTVVDAT
jgi:uncharacterized protein (TIGR02246 family)